MTPINHLRGNFVSVVNGIGVTVGRICEAVELVCQELVLDGGADHLSLLLSVPLQPPEGFDSSALLGLGPLGGLL